jgi:uncharacterized protein (TIGR03086 family)
MTEPSDVDLLESVLDKAAGTVARVTPAQAALPTPCPEYDVATLVDHMTGWAARFASRVTGAGGDADPNAHRAGPDPAAEVRQAAAQIVLGYRDGVDGAHAMPVGVLLMEFQVHGWDLARATGQEPPFSDAEATRALELGRQLMSPDYRGPDQAFGHEVEPPPGAPVLDRLVAFLGRDPGWHAPG